MTTAATTTDTADAKPTSKKAFDLARDSVYKADPLELRLVGGLDTLPDDQRGPLDTPRDESHVLWDPRLLDVVASETVHNIDAYGVLTPIIIAKIDGVPTVVDGRQRVRAARLANLLRKSRGEPTIKIACTVSRADETRLMGTMIATNEVRHDDDFGTKLYKLKRLLGRGVDIEDAAGTFGVSAAIAKSWLRFDDNAIDEVKKAVESGKLALSAGIEVARIKDPEKQKAALTTIETAPAAAKSLGGKTSVKEARAAIKKATGKKGPTNATDKKTQRALLAHLQDKDHPKTTSERTIAWYQGVEDALMIVLGEGASAGVTKLREMLDALESS